MLQDLPSVTVLKSNCAWLDRKFAMYDVREIEHVWIPMPDGIRLAARIWLPANCSERLPAVLEYIPYRKRDLVRARDERNHPYFAARGFACLRVDMRGSGDSEGVMTDMYSEHELDDARRVIEWTAGQAWSNGRVGMFGTSWGGTASLQAAVDAPEPLKAVLANCATCDRFEDDIHWMGGCLLTDSLEWGATLPAILACPPDSATVGDAWMQIWLDRLEKLEFPVEKWVLNSTRGRYWRRGSVRFNAERLSCPILTIGGWSDRYSNSVMPLVQARPDIVWGIVGPWGHHFPDQGDPGPAIGFQDLALEWWNHWLRSDEPGEYLHPKLRIWRRRFDPPGRRLGRRSGEWIQLGSPRRGQLHEFHVSKEGLAPEPCPFDDWFVVPFDSRHGACAGDTGYFGRIDGLPLEQSADDSRSLCFDSCPLDDALDLFGSSVLAVACKRASAPAQLVCRLCDVSPDGESSLVVRTVINLELDELLDRQLRFSAGEPNSLRVSFPTTSYRFARGHRVRLSLAAGYWPLVWPSALDPELKVGSGSRLEMPLEPDDAGSLETSFPAARILPAEPTHHLLNNPGLHRTGQQVEGGQVKEAWNHAPATTRFESTGLTAGAGTSAEYAVSVGKPRDARCDFTHFIRIGRVDGTAEVESRLSAAAQVAAIEFRGTLHATWNGEEIARKDWRFAAGPDSLAPQRNNLKSSTGRTAAEQELAGAKTGFGQRLQSQINGQMCHNDH